MKIKTNYYKKLESDLYNYKALKQSIVSLRKDIEEFERIDGVNSVSFDSLKISKTFKFSSSVEDSALSNIEKIDYIRHCIRRTEDTIKNIEEAFELLTQEERDIIEYRYIDNKPWYNIAYKVKYNERWCRELRKRAMVKMAISVYGKRAVLEPFSEEES